MNDRTAEFHVQRAFHLSSPTTASPTPACQSRTRDLGLYILTSMLNLRCLLQASAWESGAWASDRRRSPLRGPAAEDGAGWYEFQVQLGWACKGLPIPTADPVRLHIYYALNTGASIRAAGAALQTFRLYASHPGMHSPRQSLHILAQPVILIDLHQVAEEPLGSSIEGQRCSRLTSNKLECRHRAEGSRRLNA